MGARHGRLAAGLCAAWESEMVSARTLSMLAEAVEMPQQRARLLVLSAFNRAHAARLLARLSAMGRGPLPVPQQVDELPGDVAFTLEREAILARIAAGRYGQLAIQARAQGDVSSAWVCELNRSEEEDRALALRELLVGVATEHFPESDLQSAPA